MSASLCKLLIFYYKKSVVEAGRDKGYKIFGNDFGEGEGTVTGEEAGFAILFVVLGYNLSSIGGIGDNLLTGDAVRRCYKATPKRMWMNDYEEKDGKFVRDYRVEIDLK